MKLKKVIGYGMFVSGRVYHKCVKGYDKPIFLCKNYSLLESMGDKFSKEKPKGKRMCAFCAKRKEK